MTNQMEIYKASAGSGKTFRLTLNYLKLALQQPTAFRSIQAVTFTNKATAEMKHRILEVLHGLATESKGSAAYREVLLQELPTLTGDTLTHHAAATYSAILHDYSRFNISTIDAFVQRIIRSFAWELGIDSGFRLQLAIEPVQEALTERLFNLLDTDKNLLEWITQLAKSRLEEGKNWNPRESLQALSNIIFSESFEVLEQALAAMSEAEIEAAFQALRQQVYATIKAIETRRKTAAEKVLQAVEQAGVLPSDLFQGGKGSLTTLQATAKGDIVALNSYGKKLLNNEPLAKKKLPAERAERVAAIEDAVVDMLRTLDQWNKNDIPDHATAQLIRENLGELKLVRTLANELSAYRSEENLLLMSDIHALLRRLTQDSDVSFMYEKTGQYLHHFLMDEFQDTSTFQWSNFRPLVLESLAAGQYNMLVGDVKQAIYRWRNGDWRLLHEGVQQDLQGHRPTTKSLTDNFRSAAQVIEFNNLLFHLGPRWLQDQLNTELDKSETAISRLQDRGYYTMLEQAYADSFQEIPAGARQDGYVCMTWLDANAEQDAETDEETAGAGYDAMALRQLAAQIDALLAEGFLPGDLAVITRTNSEAAKVVTYLIDHQREGAHRYQVVSGEALKLGSNAAIQLLLAVMQWLHQPENTLALTEAGYLYALLHQSPETATATFTQPVILPPQLANPSPDLMGLPAQELLHQLISLLSLDGLEEHGAFLLAFADLVAKNMAYGDTSLPAFLQFWEDEGHKAALPASSGDNAVEVVTVHKSKGLAYRVVLMPYLGFTLKPKGPLLLVPTKGSGFEALPMLPVKWKQSMAQSHFAEAYYEEMALTMMDNLNVLYVACTRARDRIYGWSPAYEENAKATTAGNLILKVAQGNGELPGAAYTDTRTGFDTAQQVWAWGTPVAPAPRTARPVAAPDQLAYTLWQDRVKVRYQALQTTHDEVDQLPRKQGLLWHDMVHRMERPSDLSKVLAQMQQAGLMTDRDAAKAATVMTQMLALPALQPWHAGTHRRLAERAIVQSGGLMRRPDLVLYQSEETLVYDFKFTEGRKDQPGHEAQVQEYMQLLAAMRFPGIRGILVYALEKATVDVPLSPKTQQP